MLAHELQHAREIAESQAQDLQALTQFFEESGFRSDANISKPNRRYGPNAKSGASCAHLDKRCIATRSASRRAMRRDRHSIATSSA
jgi:hypothetical protein